MDIPGIETVPKKVPDGILENILINCVLLNDPLGRIVRLDYPAPKSSFPSFPAIRASMLLYGEHRDTKLMPPKRACDACILRKVKCNGAWPCGTCRNAVKRVPCTYLKPVRKRGPKTRRMARKDQDLDLNLDSWPIIPGYIGDQQGAQQNDLPILHAESTTFPETACTSRRISKAILSPIVHLYQQHSYSVWPVVNAGALLEGLDDIEPETIEHDTAKLACLATALSAATMAQLHLAPVKDGTATVDSTGMAQACLSIRSRCRIYEENVDLSSILVSFFLHVYHAKMNQCSLAMMYIQEAIRRAQTLGLDEELSISTLALNYLPQDDFVANKYLIFPLLWVSERGYALHLGLSPSYRETPSLKFFEQGTPADIHVRGLVDLVKLFIAFDEISRHRKCTTKAGLITNLVETESKLSLLSLEIADTISTRTADCHITREWMRTIVWQEALSLGLLSSASSTDAMTFGFPAKVGHNLLQSLRLFTEEDLLPLGRDQLLKCFEVANSLADTILLSLPSYQTHFELGPPDFLHALYQKLLPFLAQDPMLDSILRSKTAEILIMAPARLLTVQASDIDLQAGRRGQAGATSVASSLTSHNLLR
ncbi:uncharacterized protein N7482_004423 [Penicillium canariense]|uniref:Zn(2)-C6 fungal-type domain-containing protein n=1 Tax=Penicillium canariense TaxID=189055 RepID=A0A9W9I8Q7_9EURO|nr:uncharacterized protein N7482_004423 [Penicillium canariense]KAJ5168829.1 hypothetical protein N7482_004423 [Penicillium canariense]